MISVSELTVYPVKSGAGIGLQEATLDPFGLRGDRRWLVVSPQGHFLTQRDEPRMALLTATPVSAGLSLALDEDTLSVSAPDEGASERRVQVWSDQVWARDAGDAVAAWLTSALGRECRLVYMPDDAVRRVDGLYASEGETVSFADGFPLLLISQASLADLNSRLPAPVPMNRFRPNIVVDGCEAFAEDGWRRLRIGAIELTVAKPCSRCVMPSIDQATGERDSVINRVLASYRRRDGQVYFGQNLLYQHTGPIAVGDAVEVLDG
ncbi:MAG: MOSC domain-containing protein [Halieaceae bacterium]